MVVLSSNVCDTPNDGLDIGVEKILHRDISIVSFLFFLQHLRIIISILQEFYLSFIANSSYGNRKLEASLFKMSEMELCKKRHLGDLSQKLQH